MWKSKNAGIKNENDTPRQKKIYLWTTYKDIEEMWKDKCFVCKVAEFLERELRYMQV